MAVDIDSLKKKSPLPLDANSLKADGTPFTSIAEAHASVSSSYICVGDVRIIIIDGVQITHWYKDGIAQENLVPRDLDAEAINDALNTLSTRVDNLDDDIESINTTLDTNVLKLTGPSQTVQGEVSFEADTNFTNITIDGALNISQLLFINPAQFSTTYADNAAALAGGVAPGLLYRRSAGGLDIAFQEAPPPNYVSHISNLSTRTFYVGGDSQQQYKAQNASVVTGGVASKPYACQVADNRINPFVRFMLKDADRWPTDVTNNNDQNGRIKERSEIYSMGTAVPFNIDVWLSWYVKIEPGEDVIYTNTAYYCDLGQWHHSGGSGGPPFNFNLSGQGTLKVETRNGTGGELTTRATLDLTRGNWHRIVVRAKFHKSNGGELQVWLDGFEECNVSGITLGYIAETNAGYMKYGIYRTPDLLSNAPNDLAVQYACMEMRYNGQSLFDRVNSPLPLV